MERSLNKWFVPTFVASMILGPSNRAALADSGGPQTEPVAGSFKASPVPGEVQQRMCVGEDGPYLELRGRWAGVTTSTDPRLSGNLKFRADRALVNLATGFGTFQGPFTISDPTTGEEKVQGNFHVVLTGGGLNNHGFLFGRVMGAGRSGDDDGESSDIVFANFTSILDRALNVTGLYGEAGDPTRPAVLQTGQCTGPFTRIP